MNMKCPKCGREYETELGFSYCEDDREELVEMEPQQPSVPAWKKQLPSILALIGLASLVAVLPWYITGRIKDGLKVELDESRLVESARELKLPLKVVNSSSFGFEISDVQFNLRVLGVQLVKDARVKLDLRVPAKGSERFQIPVDVTLKNIHSQLLEMKLSYGESISSIQVNGSFWGLPVSVTVKDLDFISSSAVLKDWLAFKEPVISPVFPPEIKPVTSTGGNVAGRIAVPKTKAKEEENGDLVPLKTGEAGISVGSRITTTIEETLGKVKKRKP